MPAVLERLPEHVKDMAVEFRELIQKQDTVMGKTYLARSGCCSAADESRIRDGVVGSAKGTSTD